MAVFVLRDQLFGGFDALRRRYQQHIGHHAENGDAGKILGRIVGEVWIGGGRGGMRRGIDQKRVAVGVGLGDDGGADGAAGAGAILHHDGLAKLFR